MPVIVDVDADGQTEMLISCGPNAVNGNIIAFKSAGAPWSKSRPVWNQHAFFNININDDLSIPIQQQNPNIVRNSIVMNTFLNQYSNPVFPLPDLIINTLGVLTCSDPHAILTLEICNNGDAPLTEDLQLSYYDGDPTTETGLAPVNFSFDQQLEPDDCGLITFQVDLPVSGFIYVVLNDNGTLSTLFSIENSFPLTNLFECNYANNILGTFVQNPNIVSVVDTMVCGNDSIYINNIGLGANADTVFVFTKANNCDSLIRFVVASGIVPLSTEEIIICPGDSVSVFGDFVSAPATYQQVTPGTNGCDSIAEIILTLNPAIQISLDITHSCSDQENGRIIATASEGTPPYSFAWSNGATNRQLTDLPAGSYALTVTDFMGCTTSESVDLIYHNITSPGLSITPVSCPGDHDGILLLENISPGLSYAILPDTFRETPQFSDLFAGDYTLTVRDTAGCLYDFPFNIPETQTDLDITEDQIITLGDDLQLQSFIVGVSPDSLTYQWFPENSLSCTDCPNPVAAPVLDTEYQLTVTTSRGCVLEASVFISVKKDKAVYIPNAFSPNADGINDRFLISTDQSVERIQSLRIYNRWGALIYENLQFPPDDYNAGWNGSFKNKQLNSGVYVYVVIIEFVDQTTQQFSGDVTLFR